MKNINLKQFLIDACGLAIVFMLWLFVSTASSIEPMADSRKYALIEPITRYLGFFLSGWFPIKFTGAILPRLNHNLVLYTLLPLLMFYLGKSVVKSGIGAQNSIELSICVAGIIIGYIWPHKRAVQYQQESKQNVAPTH